MPAVSDPKESDESEEDRKPPADPKELDESEEDRKPPADPKELDESEEDRKPPAVSDPKESDESEESEYTDDNPEPAAVSRSYRRMMRDYASTAKQLPVAKETTLGKAAAKKRKEKEENQVREMETCEIDQSDPSDSEHDFKNLAMKQPPNKNWVLPLYDTWESQDSKKNQKICAKHPTESHCLTAKEVLFKYPKKKGPLPLGRMKCI